MSRRWTVVALAAVVMTAGCGGSGGGRRAATHGPVSSAWASPSELRWLRLLGAWQNELSAAAQRVAATTAANNLATALSPLAHCSDLLQSDVGPAPTRRLQRAYSLFGKSCGSWSKASSELLQADGGDVGGARADVHHALAYLERADALLPPGELHPLPKGEPSPDESRIVPRLSRIASTLARHRSVVRCWSRSDWRHLVREERELSVSRVDERAVGITSLSAHRINLHPAICNVLQLLLERKHVPLGRATFAVQVLSHESQHSAGVASEAAADCFGMQRIARTAQLLGLSRSYGARLAQNYWRHWKLIAAIYRSPQCRDGGSLDLDPHSSQWP